jgi:hypothetical protein
MHNPTARHLQRASWAVTGLETGVVLFGGGITLLHLNPFWHLDESGVLDWRVHWWNAGAELLAALGLLTLCFALLWSLAVIVSRIDNRKPWPYRIAFVSVLAAVVWVVPSGLVRDMDAHFEWDTADGFNVFRLQTWDSVSRTFTPVDSSFLKWLVEIQLQPILRGYFRLNDWPKMNGEVSLKVARIVPVAWPVGLGSGGESFEDPDQTALMRAAGQGDVKTVKQLLASATTTEVNSLDQGGQSALILACQSPNGNPEVVKALIAAGANVNLRSRNGYTALTWANTRNNPEITRMLRRAGARP